MGTTLAASDGNDVDDKSSGCVETTMRSLRSKSRFDDGAGMIGTACFLALEPCHFNIITLRKTSIKLGLGSEAATNSV